MRFYIRYFTLRSEMAKEGWDATGLLEPLWLTLEPPIADTLAALADVHVKTIYSANSGKKKLGYRAGAKLAAATGVSLAELGAPAEAAGDQASQQIRHRLAKIEAEALTVEDLQPLLRVVQLLAAGKRAEAQRALSEAGLAGL